MHMHNLPGTDLHAAAVCYGCGSVGTVLRGDELDRVFHTFRDAGGNFFDTAHCYSYWIEGGTGASELALADYFRRHGGRNEVVIATKGGIPTVHGYRKVEWHLSPGRIAADIDDSLGRLDVDTIDLYWLHRDDTRLPAGEIIETLNAEIQRGRIRYPAASNWTAARIGEANDYAAAHGLRGFVASQPEWSLAHPVAEVRDPTTHHFTDDDLAWHERHKLPVIPYSPTAGGYFATGGRAAAAASDNNTSRRRLQRAEALAREIGCTPGQIALAYLMMSRDFIVIPILGAKQIDHLRDGIAATTICLTPTQLSTLA